jgi:hypothetical protein
MTNMMNEINHSEIKAKSCYQFYDIVNKITKANTYNDDSKLDISTTNVEPELFFGITIPKKFQIKFLDDDKTITYPVGNHICFYDVKYEKTKYARLDCKLKIGGFFAFNFLKYLIIEEKLDQYLKIRFFDMTINKFDEKEFHLDRKSELMDLTISEDGIKCALVYKNPEWKLAVWCLDTFSLVSEIKIFSQNSFRKTINQIGFYPKSNKKIILLGNSVLSSFILNSDILSKEWDFCLGSNYISHLWLNDSCILIGDDNGQIILFDTSLVEIEQIFDVTKDFHDEKELLSRFSQKTADKINLQKIVLEAEDESDSLKVNENLSSTSFFHQASIKSNESNEKKSLDNSSNTDILVQNTRQRCSFTFGEIENQIELLAKQTHILEINQIVEISNGFIVLVSRNKIGIYMKNLLGNYELNSVGILNPTDSSRKNIFFYIKFIFVFKLFQRKQKI